MTFDVILVSQRSAHLIPSFVNCDWNWIVRADAILAAVIANGLFSFFELPSRCLFCSFVIVLLDFTFPLSSPVVWKFLTLLKKCSFSKANRCALRRTDPFPLCLCLACHLSDCQRIPRADYESRLSVVNTSLAYKQNRTNNFSERSMESIVINHKINVRCLLFKNTDCENFHLILSMLKKFIYASIQRY